VTESPRARFDPAALVGLPVDEAVRLVEAAGRRSAVFDVDAVVTLAWISDLVRLWVRDGRVESATIG
jgi:hypothetical protein